jgi:8-oxo-dGTP pyrophosphatase MutT (NUDIX family)
VVSSWILKNEKYGDQTCHKTKLPMWKFPGGLLDAHEHLGVASTREVFEETGIKSEFVGILGFRHQYNFRFDKMDIYFFCLLKPTSFDLNPDPEEIALCKWMDFDEFFGMNHFSYTQMEAKGMIQSYLNDPKTFQFKESPKNERRSTIYTL